jgi:hypothetical protein
MATVLPSSFPAIFSALHGWLSVVIRLKGRTTQNFRSAGRTVRRSSQRSHATGESIRRPRGSARPCTWRSSARVSWRTSARLTRLFAVLLLVRRGCRFGLGDEGFDGAAAGVSRPMFQAGGSLAGKESSSVVSMLLTDLPRPWLFILMPPGIQIPSAAAKSFSLRPAQPR